MVCKSFCLTTTRIEFPFLGKSYLGVHVFLEVFNLSYLSYRYGFMFGRESARKELGELIEDLRRRADPSSGSPPHP